MTIADLLEESRALMQQRADLKKQLTRVQGAPSAGACGGAGGLCAPQTYHPDAMRAMEEMERLQTEISHTEEALRVNARKLAPLIDRAPPGTPRMALTLRYLEWMPMAEVARATRYDHKYIYRLMQRAEKSLRA